MPIPKKENKPPKPWFEMKSTAPKEAEIMIYDQIGKDYWGDNSSVEAKKFIADLKGLGELDTLNIRINSPGGSVVEGNAIYNALKSHTANKVVTIDSLAASMASVIAMVGDTVNMPKNAMMMIHNPQSSAYGDANDMRQRADILDKFKVGSVSAYVQKTGKSEDEISTLMDDTTWMTADEALALGFCDAVIDPVDISASFDLSKFENVPEAFVAMISASKNPEAPVNNKEGEIPMPITLEQLKKEAPELLASIQAEAKQQAGTTMAVDIEKVKLEAAQAELKRIQDVEAQLISGQEDLINKLKNDGKTTGPEAAIQVVNAIKKLGADYTTALKADAIDPINADKATDNKEEDPTTAKTELTMDEATALYNSDPRVKKQFSSVRNFYHFRKNANK